MEKVKTGINGFDDLVEGGFPRGSPILVSGTPGTGKTIFSLQFLYNGCYLYDENVLYVTFEERKSNLLKQALQFGWDFSKFSKKKKAFFIDILPSEINHHSVEEIISVIKSHKIQRLVIDSLSSLAINAPATALKEFPPNKYVLMKFVYNFVDRIRSLENTTSLIISQTNEERALSNDSISEFLCDGIVQFNFESLGGEFSRSLLVRKMRRTKNNEDVHPVEISDKGIVIHRID